MSSRITILVAGSVGDVLPQLALGAGLLASGHDVTVVTHELFAEQVRALGLGFRPLKVNPRAVLETEEGLAWLRSQANPIKAARTMVALIRPMLRDVLDDAWQACQGAEVLLCSSMVICGYDIAESLGIPCLFTAMSPVRRSRSIPAVGAAPLPLGPGYNLLTHLINQQLNWQPFRAIINQWRVDDLGLRPEPRWGARRMLDWPHIPVLYAYSPAVLPRPRDWPANQHVTGYWFLNGDGPVWQPTAELRDFLDAGPAPVYVGFGSMTDPDPAQLTEIVLAAVRGSGQRAVVLSGWAELAEQRADDVLVVDAVAHSWLFPRVAAAVHHGGAGTSGAALRAGVTSVPVPYFFDQPLWAYRMAALGAATRPIPRQALTPDRLAAAIGEAVGKPALRERAGQLGAAIRAEDGVDQAVAVINKHLSNRP